MRDDTSEQNEALFQKKLPLAEWEFSEIMKLAEPEGLLRNRISRFVERDFVPLLARRNVIRKHSPNP